MSHSDAPMRRENDSDEPFTTVKEQRGKVFAHGSESGQEWIEYDGPSGEPEQFR